MPFSKDDIAHILRGICFSLGHRGSVAEDLMMLRDDRRRAKEKMRRQAVTAPESREK